MTKTFTAIVGPPASGKTRLLESIKDGAAASSLNIPEGSIGLVGHSFDKSSRADHVFYHWKLGDDVDAIANLCGDGRELRVWQVEAATPVLWKKWHTEKWPYANWENVRATWSGDLLASEVRKLAQRGYHLTNKLRTVHMPRYPRLKLFLNSPLDPFRLNHIFDRPNSSFKLVNDVASADAVVVEADPINVGYVPIDQIHYDKPLIAIDASDAVYIDGPRLEMLQDERVKLYAVNIMYRDHNAYSPEVRGHMRKVELVFHLPFRVCHEPVKPLAEREYDATFIGCVNYGGQKEAERSRALSIAGAANSDARTYIHGCDVQHRMNGNEYRKIMQNSKIAISPYGFSEWSMRDMEAIDLGCVLFKQDSSHCLTIPDIYSGIAWEYSNDCSDVTDELNELMYQMNHTLIFTDDDLASIRHNCMMQIQGKYRTAERFRNACLRTLNLVEQWSVGHASRS